MADLTLVEEEVIAAPPETVFDLLCDLDEGGLLGASGDSMRRGAVVQLDLPMGSGFGGALRGAGRITHVARPRKLVIEHESPWRGRVVCTVAPVRGGSRVRIVATVPEEAMRWLLRRRGNVLAPECEPGCVPIGLLTCQSGPGSLGAGAATRLAQLAVEEINEDGPPTGDPLRLVAGDDGTNPVLAAAEARRLLEDEGCPVMLFLGTSNCFDAVVPVVEAAGALLVYCNTNEGGGVGRRIFRLGERPANQLSRAIPRLMREHRTRRWFLAGNDYSFPRATHAYARRAVDAAGGRVVGEGFVPLGTRRFSGVVEAIHRAGAEMVLSTFVGTDAADFHRQFVESGLHERCQVLGPAIDDSTREHIGDRVASGLWGVFGYFSDMPTPDNEAFLERYYARFGEFSPPPSSFSEAVYEAVHLVARAAVRARSFHPDDVADRLAGSTFSGPRGSVRIADPATLTQQLYLAEAVPGGFAIRTAV